MKKIPYGELVKMNPGVRASSEAIFGASLFSDSTTDRSKTPIFGMIARSSVGWSLVAVKPLGIQGPRREMCFQYYCWEPAHYRWKESHILFDEPWLHSDS